MSKSKIHFHCDNTYWAGSEQMLVCLFSSQKFLDNFNISFSYRQTRKFETSMYKWWHKAGIGWHIDSTGGQMFWNDVNLMFPLQLFSSKFYGKWYWPFKYLAFFSDTCRIKKALEKINPDVLVVWNGGYPGSLSCNAAVLAARLLKVQKIIYFVNNMPKKRSSIQRLIEWPMDNLNRQEVNVFLSGSETVAWHMTKQFKAGDHAEGAPFFINIPNTIHQQPIKKSRKQIRKELGVPEKQLLVVSAGVLEKRKGHKYLLEAWMQLLPNAFLAIIGTGPEKKNLTWLAGSFALCDDVEDAYSYINACDIYVQPSIEHEDFPITVLQAMSLGKPVVGSAVAGIPEQIAKTGFLVRSGNVGDLAENLKILIENDSLRKALGRKAKKKYKNTFEYSIIIDRYIKFFKGLL